MSAKVYVQAGVIAAVGVAIAVVDSTRRPVKTPEPMASPDRSVGGQGATNGTSSQGDPKPAPGEAPKAAPVPESTPPEKTGGQAGGGHAPSRWACHQHRFVWPRGG